MNQTPHRIGNNGEAPMDTDDWDQLPVWKKLERLADDLRNGARGSRSGIEEWYEAEACEVVVGQLENIAGELWEECRDRGIVL